MLSPRLDEALVLGMGSGGTAGTVALLFEQTDVVEINKVVLDNLHRMAEYNFEIESRPNIDIVHDDPDREHAYTAGADQILETGRERGWTMASICNTSSASALPPTNPDWPGLSVRVKIACQHAK